MPPAPPARRKRPASAARTPWLALGALGVVYGDIGTSPLYALKECFSPERGIGIERAEVLGVLSLVFWALIAVVSLKYLGLILRADNNDEGGVLALSALLRRGGPLSGKATWIALGVFGAALLYGDAMITPAITVLSALELQPALQPWAVPGAIAILIPLFLLQAKGTERVGTLFGPIMLAWFGVLAVLGACQVIRTPGVLEAVAPWHAARFLSAHGTTGLGLLGVVFLVVTGAEALYADMGHFGAVPIRLAWTLVVLPALCLNYFGQGALLLSDPGAVSRPLFALAPSWFQAPLLALAIIASVVASQAVISGAFSLTRQAIQLGYSPRMRVVHTSARTIGQIYVPEVNWLLLCSTVGLVLAFRSSSALASAYGLAVSTTMLITTLLFCLVAREWAVWKRRLAFALCGPLLLLDLGFFVANLAKLGSGAWVSLLVGSAIFTLMSTWHRGRLLLAEKFEVTLPTIAEFLRTVGHETIPRVPNKAVFLTSSPRLAPPAILHNLKHNRILHGQVAFLTIVTREVPRVRPEDRVTVRDLGDGFHQVTAYYGFMQDPNVPEAIGACRDHGLDLDPERVSYYLSRQQFLPTRMPGMSRWRQHLFAVLTRNTLSATTYFHLPPGQVVELGSLVHI